MGVTSARTSFPLETTQALLMSSWEAWCRVVLLFDVSILCLLGATSSGFGTALLARKECLKFLLKKLCKIVRLTECQKNELKIYDRLKAKEFTGIDNLWGIHPFFIPRGKNDFK